MAIELVKDTIIKQINEELEKAINEISISSLLSLDSSLSFEAIKTHIIFPCNDMICRGGKRIRPLLLILLTKLLEGNEEEAFKASPIIEAMHTASLIHDDIEDSSPKRRGEPSTYIKYGLDVALNAGSSLYFFALALIARHKKEVQASLYNLCVNALSLLHIGQAMDIKHHSNYNLHFDMAMYEHLVTLKTGTLFSLSANLALIFSNKRNSLLPQIFNEAGVAFQMFDDLKNVAKTGIKGKEQGDDIVEGKLSFPIVLYLEEHPDDKEKIISYFTKAKKEGIFSKAIQDCCLLLESSGVIEKGFNIAKNKLDACFNQLKNIHGTSPYFDMVKDIFNRL